MAGWLSQSFGGLFMTTKFEVDILGHTQAGKTSLLLGLYDYLQKEYEKYGTAISDLKASEALSTMRTKVIDDGILIRSEHRETISYQFDDCNFEITAQTGNYFGSLDHKKVKEYTQNNKLLIIAINPFSLGVRNLSANTAGNETIAWQSFKQFVSTLRGAGKSEVDAATEGLNRLFCIDIAKTIHKDFNTAITGAVNIDMGRLEELINHYFTKLDYSRSTKNLLDIFSRVRNNRYMIVITHGDVLGSFLKYNYQQTIKMIGALLSEEILRNIQVRQIYVSSTIHLSLRENGDLKFEFDSGSAEIFHNQILSFMPRRRWPWLP